MLVATGSGRRKLEAINADKFEHKGITYCASCDGPLFADQDVLVIGVAIIVDVVAPVFHEYVDAPLAVNTTVLPTHTAVDVATTVGNAVTDNIPTAEFVQPAIEVPITV